MGSNCFSALEIDAVGEILNISLGASATAVSTMLNTRVDITTPVVNVVRKDEFKMDRVEPAIGVEITYISGLEGSNVMLLKRHDVRVIVEMLMGIPMTDEEFELNEMNISAVCEVMNQMMGASSTALSEFLGKVVNISTPISFEVENEKAFIDKYFSDDDYRVVVKFALKIADQLESEFFNVMPISLAKSLVKGFLPDDVIVDPANVNEETKDVPNEEAAPSSGGKQTLSQEEIESLLNAEGSTQAMFAAACRITAGSNERRYEPADERTNESGSANEFESADYGAAADDVGNGRCIYDADANADDAADDAANAADAATAGGKTKSGRTKTDQRAADGATGSESGPRRGSSGRTGRKYGTDHGGSA